METTKKSTLLVPPFGRTYSRIITCSLIRVKSPPSLCRVFEEDVEPNGDWNDLVQEERSPKKRVSSWTGKRLSVLHRLRQSRSHLGKKHSAETREKIRQTMIKRSRERKKQKASENPTPPSVTIPKLNKNSDDYLVMEKAILELTSLRRDVALWLDQWYSKHEHKPTLEDVAENSPEVHNKFIRFIALREFIRSKN
eukprot:g5245.t1